MSESWLEHVKQSTCLNKFRREYVLYFKPLQTDHGESPREMQDRNEQITTLDDGQGISDHSIQNRYMEDYEDMDVR